MNLKLVVFAVLSISIIVGLLFYNSFLPKTYGYWGNMRCLFFTGKAFGGTDVPSGAGSKYSARFTCPLDSVVKGVYGELMKNPEYKIEVKWGVQGDDGDGLPNNEWLGYWRGFLDNVRPLHLFSQPVSLQQGKVYHIVCEVLQNPESRAMGYHAYNAYEQFQSYDWRSDPKLDLLVYEGGKWNLYGKKVIPMVCVVTQDENMSFPIAGIDLLYSTSSNFFVYAMNNFPRSLLLNQLVVKMVRMGDLGEVTIKVIQTLDNKVLATTTFPIMNLPLSSGATFELVMWENYVWNFSQTIRLEAGKDYKLTFQTSGSLAKVASVYQCQPYEWFGAGAWNNDMGSFYGHDFYVSQIGSYIWGSSPSSDFIFAFRTIS